ncbi:hypothetical protein F8388_004243 [Cannabis sativa]|uniref:General transcription and DNA repair factor IIH subunit TFB5 n=1 Tax=Cannabis sativa TaxID=3483 RepID=A0A7J6F9L8_CANSA|nr:hypothetical protein F8388_004243 [Cannabis sativa]
MPLFVININFADNLSDYKLFIALSFITQTAARGPTRKSSSSSLSHFKPGLSIGFLLPLPSPNGFRRSRAQIDIPMAQFIINMNAALPASQKFIIHVLDNTHLFVQPHAAEMIRSAVQEFRDQNSYEKPN